MALQKFIDVFGGHRTLVLCQYLAIAHTNTPMEGVDITPYEAHKYLIGNLENPQQYDFSKSDWLAIRKEISDFININKSNKSYLDTKISEHLMAFTEIACFFYPSAEINVDASIHKLFNCIVETYLKATANHSSADYAEILSSSEATSKWNRESLQAIAKIGIALRKFANLLQGCIYTNGLRNTVSHYQQYCGVTLATEFTNATIADAMYWTKIYAEKICKLKKPTHTTNLTIDSILAEPGLKMALEAGLIDKDGVVQGFVSDLVRFFNRKKLYNKLTKADFAHISGILKTGNGEPISSQRLSRAATDLKKECHMVKNKKHIKK